MLQKFSPVPSDQKEQRKKKEKKLEHWYSKKIFKVL